MKISVVVPAFNEERLLGETLKRVNIALSAFTQRGWAAELIVCDNNSTDRTAEIARLAGATVVFEPVNQIARARNGGAAVATGDWLIFVDADSHPTMELFADVAKQIAAGRCVAGGCTLRLDEFHPAAWCITHLWNGASRFLRLMAGSFIFVETKVFRELGGFSHELFVAEELELSKRLKKFAKENGRKIVILHRHPLVTSARKMRLYTAREHLRFLRKTVFNQRKAMTDPAAAHLWYDGRR